MKLLHVTIKVLCSTVFTVYKSMTGTFRVHTQTLVDVNVSEQLLDVYSDLSAWQENIL